MTTTITSTRDLKELAHFFVEFPEISAQAAQLAINETVDREGMAILKKDMRDQINFPAGYLEGDRLKVTKRASKGDLEAVIRGRDRATSLARFAQGQTPQNTRGRGVRVTLRNGQTKVLRKSFLISLRNGNTGLAVRLKPGESIRESQSAKEMAPGLWLLYGPSVDQVFRGVADDRAEDVANIVYAKFLRQFTRLSSRG